MASVRNTSLKWLSSVIWRSGRTSTPGCFIGQKKKLIPDYGMLIARTNWNVPKRSFCFSASVPKASSVLA